MSRLLSRFFVLVFLAVTVTVLPGCGQSGEAENTGDRPRVALIMKSLANEFFVTMAQGAEEHQKAHADEYDLIVNGIKDENDIGQQVALVEQMIAMNVDAIVLAPADSRALIPAAKKALDAGIVVVNIDNKFDAEVLQQTGIQVPFVGPDNREGARMVGEELVRYLKVGDPVAIIEGTPTAFNSQQRRLGFEDAMNAAGMRIVSVQSGYWEQARANTVVAALLSEHPELKALLCANDNMALGAAAAVRQVGRVNEVAIVGFDNISAIQDMVQDGRVKATADQHADQLAVYGIEFALQILNGESVPEDRQTPVDLITTATLSGTQTAEN